MGLAIQVEVLSARLRLTLGIVSATPAKRVQGLASAPELQASHGVDDVGFKPPKLCNWVQGLASVPELHSSRNVQNLGLYPRPFVSPGPGLAP